MSALDEMPLQLYLVAGVVSVWVLYRGASALLRSVALRLKIRKHLEKVRAREKYIRREISTEDAVDTLITPKRRQILNLGLEELLDQLNSDKLRPVEVLEAYQASALEAHEKYNCICTFFTEARDWALALEDLPRERRGPFYGLPISLKECIIIKGYCNTVGFSRFLDEPAAQDGAFVTVMKGQGAVPFCHTNVPQTMKSYTCSNPIYGTTLNPWDPSRTSGGSSGGESSLVSAGGSVLGVGTDGSGSLRIPALFCGITSLKPTTGRFLNQGRKLGSKGHLVGVCSDLGFLTRSVEELLFSTRILLKSSAKLAKIDTSIVPIPWNEALFAPKRKLRIGWYANDSVFPSIPACRRAVNLCVTRLTGAGHTLVPFEPPHLKKLQELFFNFSLADSGQLTLDWLNDDFVDQSVKTAALVWKLPWMVRRFILKPALMLTSPLLASVVDVGYFTSSQLWLGLEEEAKIKQEILKEWNKLNLDVLIGPGFPFAAPQHHIPSQLLLPASITAAYNQLDLPAGAVTVTKVNSQDQELLARQYPTGDKLYNLVRSAMQGSEGLPVGVQVIGKPFEEERVLAVMAEIESLIGEKFRPDQK